MIINRTGELAAKRGITTQELAERAEIAYNTALNLVRGVTARIDLEVLDRVCGVLEVEPGDLLVREGSTVRREGRNTPAHISSKESE